MDYEKALLSKALQVGQVERLVVKGIQPQYFTRDNYREIMMFCMEYIQNYKTSPSIDVVRDRFPDFRVEVISDSLDYLYDNFVRHTKRREAIAGLRSIAKMIDNDPDGIGDIDHSIIELGSSLSEMFPIGNASHFSDMKRRITAYEAQESQGAQMGIPFGIPVIDDKTMGIQPHEFISVVGWQGVGKSTLAQVICFSAYIAGFTPLIISLEMEAQAMFRRFDIMATNLRYYALKKLELSSSDKAKWEEWAERAGNLSNDIIVIDDVSSCTLERVYAIARQYKPDLLVVDYVSLMDAPSKNKALWESVTELTKGLKRIARDSQCPPVIGIAQTNIGSAIDGANLTNISYSRSIGQDSDIVLGLYQDDNGKMKAMKQMEVRLLKNRDGEVTDAKMYWDMEHMIFREWLTSDMFSMPDKEEISVNSE